jgi:hemoglobin-like flavoprotein
MTTQDQIMASLEIVAENSGDINPAVYKRYFQMSPGSEALMAHIDDLVRGKMMEEVMRLLMLEDTCSEDEYLTFEMKTHAESYSVIKEMYKSILTAVWEVVREGLGDEWSDEFENAWRTRIESLLEAINNHIPIPVSSS